MCLLWSTNWIVISQKTTFFNISFGSWNQSVQWVEDDFTLSVSSFSGFDCYCWKHCVLYIACARVTRLSRPSIPSVRRSCCLTHPSSCSVGEAGGIDPASSFPGRLGRRWDPYTVRYCQQHSAARLTDLRQGTLKFGASLQLVSTSFKNGVFWHVTPCGSCMNRRFGGT
jgi:hypothetical protein